MLVDDPTWFDIGRELLFIAFALGCGYISMTIAQRKHQSPGWFFFIGLALNVIGILIAVLVKPAVSPPPPPPVRTMTCAGCGELHVIDLVDAQIGHRTCRNCGTTTPVPEVGAPAEAPPEQRQ